MDIFYKPPRQRTVECRALEENYVNCLMQKALKDKVFVNRCVLDSVLWFHLECPRAASKFDDPVEFKRKFRDFFAANKSLLENNTQKTPSQRRIKDQYGYTSGYPEDMRINKRVVKFQDEFEKFSVMNQRIDLDEEDPNEGKFLDQETDPVDLLYNQKLEWQQANPISLVESRRGAEQLAETLKGAQ